MQHPIVNIADLDLRPWGHGERFQARVGDIARRIGAQKLGYNLTVLPPGKRAYPAHNHRVNEEMFFVVEGAGEVRIGADRFPIRTGDVIACPPGGPETAHQIVNTSPSADMKYLSISTVMLPEIVDYPDSSKFGVRWDGGRFLGRLDDGIKDYWDGE